MYYSASYLSPVGKYTLASNGNSLVGVWLEGQKYHSSNMPDTLTEREDIPVFCTVRTWLDRYFAGEEPEISEISLAPVGGEFRQLVWGILCDIPYGKVITYGEIAKKIAVKTGKKRMSSQAVGGAIGHNPISIIIPCHRVIGSNGSLTGYAGGILTKVKLLELEGADISRLFVPKKSSAL